MVNCLSLNTVICKHNTVSCYTIWQTGAIVDTATHRHAAVRSSAEPTPHTTILRSPTNIYAHQLRLRLTLPTRHTGELILCHTVTPTLSPVTSHWTDHSKHNDTINLHAQNFCRHKLRIQTHPKISQNVHKSKRNLVANDVQISHTEFTIIIADQLMVGQ